MFWRARWLVALLLPIALTAAACGGGSGSSTSSSGPSAQDILSKSATRFQAVTTFHFRLEHQNNGYIPIVLGLHLITAEGDEVVPDRITADVQAKAGPTSVRVSVIGIGDKTWITNPFTRDWQPAPSGAEIQSVVDPVGLVTSLSKSIKQPEIAGSDEVDGVDCYHISGTIASDNLTQSLSFAEAGHTLAVDAWIGKDDSLPRRANLKGVLVGGEKDDVVRVINLTKFDAPVDIQPPK